MEVRERILAAMFACIARYGIEKTTVEDAAREAGVSRATVYRTFPGGRDELVHEVIAWEIDRFFRQLAERVARCDGFEEVVETALLHAHRSIRDHAVLQGLLLTEREQLVPAITLETSRFVPLIAAFVEPYLRAETLRDGIDVAEAAGYVARMVVSHIASPGRWDLTDPVQVQSLVRAEILAGLLA